MEITEEYLLFQDLWRSNDYKDLKKYNETLEECSAKAKCSETTATYTMTANNSINIKTCTVDEGKGNDGSKGSCTTWEETSDKKTSITTDSKNNIICLLYTSPSPRDS